MALRLLPVLLAVLVGTGCETFVEVDPTDHAPVLVVSATFEPGTPWVVYVRRSLALGDTTDVYSGLFGGPPVETATVTITGDDGTTLVLPNGGRGLYGAALREVENGEVVNPDSLYEDGPGPEVGRTYTLRVEAPGFPTATATSRTPLPATVTAEAVGGWEPERPGEPGTPYSNARVAVRIVPSEAEARYAVSVWRGPYGGAFSGGTFYTDAPLLVETPFVEDLSGGPRRRQTSAFVDLYALGGDPFMVEIEQVRSDTLGVEVLTASPAYFEAQRQAARRRAAEANPFAEPFAAYSNVEGGAGVFAGSTRTRVLVTRPGSL